MKSFQLFGLVASLPPTCHASPYSPPPRTCATAKTPPRPHVNAASPFQARGELSPGKNLGCPCASAGFTGRLLGRESFAVSCPLALIGPASDPVSVRRPAGLATPLLSATPSRSLPCGSLGSLRPTPQRTCTS